MILYIFKNPFNFSNVCKCLEDAACKLYKRLYVKLYVKSMQFLLEVTTLLECNILFYIYLMFLKMIYGILRVYARARHHVIFLRITLKITTPSCTLKSLVTI